MKNTPIQFLPLTILLALSGCDEPAPVDGGDTARIGPIADAGPHSWLVQAENAPQADNPEFAEDDTVVLDELNLPDGGHAQIVVLPADAGVGIVWLGAPP